MLGQRPGEAALQDAERPAWKEHNVAGLAPGGAHRPQGAAEHFDMVTEAQRPGPRHALLAGGVAAPGPVPEIHAGHCRHGASSPECAVAGAPDKGGAAGRVHMGLEPELPVGKSLHQSPPPHGSLGLVPRSP